MSDNGENVLSAGLNELQSMKKMLMELEKTKAENQLLSEKEVQLEKQIQAMEKQLSDKIASVTRARKAELETTYNEQMDKTKNRAKKVRAKKEKLKSSKVSERIKEETGELQEEKRQYADEIRAIYKSEKLPRLLNNPFLHAIYQPVMLRDILIICLTLAVVLFVLPCGIYFGFFRPKTSMLILTYIVTVLVFGALYLFIGWYTKERHAEAFTQIKQLRRKINKKRREIYRLSRQIRKDKDESGYGLDKYNQEITELEDDIETIEKNKKSAVKKFDSETKKVIANELAAECEEELSSLKCQYEETYSAQRAAEEKMKSLSVTVTEKYNTYIGKENMDIVLLEQLEEIIQAGDARTIREALSIQKARAREAQENV